MTTDLEFDFVSTPEDIQSLGAVLYQCFSGLPDDWISYSKSVGIANFRVVRHSSQIIGGLAIHKMGQWFESKIVPMAGIAAVGILPEYRGMGIAASLLTHTLKEIHASGIPLSVLYAATQRVYRKVGYEQAGTRCRFEIKTDDIKVTTKLAEEIHNRSLPMQPIPSFSKIFNELYQRQAIKNNGNLDRQMFIWDQIFNFAKEKPVFSYLIGPQFQPEGYVVYCRRKIFGESQLWILDWVILTPLAAKRFWHFLADHRSNVQRIVFHGPVLNSILLMLEEAKCCVQHLDNWMLRIVDVKKALEARGYPKDINTELHFDIHDNILPDNNGRFILSTTAGKGKVVKGGRGELQLNIGGLAPLYTGLFTPQQLLAAGQLEFTDTALTALSSATKLFSGPEPWMSDSF